MSELKLNYVFIFFRIYADANLKGAALFNVEVGVNAKPTLLVTAQGSDTR